MMTNQERNWKNISNCDSKQQLLNRLTTKQRCRLGQAVLCLLLIATLALSIVQVKCNTNNKLLDFNQRIIDKRQADENGTSIPSTTANPAPQVISGAVAGVMDSINNDEATSNNNEPTMAKAKIQPINYTLVDELFEARLNETEVAKKWKSLDKQLVEGKCFACSLIDNFQYISSQLTH